MSIRKNKVLVKTVSLIMAGSFAISMLFGAWMFIQNHLINKPTKEIIAEVNGEKIYKDDFAREVYEATQYSKNLFVQKKQQLGQMGIDTTNLKELPETVVEEYILKNFIDRKILLSSAKELKVNVSNADVNKQVEEMQKSAGGKDKFVQYLMNNGHNLTTFKEQLKTEMVVTKIQEKIKEGIKVSDEEIKKTYDRYQYTTFADQKFEEAKTQIVDILTNEKYSMVISSYVNKGLDNAKITFKDEKYKKMFEDSKKVVAEKEGYKFTKADLTQKIVELFFGTQQGYTEDLVANLTKEMQANLDKLVAIANKAKEVGIKPMENLVGLSQLGDYSKQYYNYLIDTYKPTEDELKARFEANRAEYNIPNTIGGYVLGEDYEPSEADWKKTETTVKELLKTINKDNFAQKAKELSEDPGSKANGGDLGGEKSLSEWVPEFAEAARKAKAGDIVGPVKTQFGYHIIYVESKNAQNEELATLKHILITPKISQETKDALKTRLTKLKDELNGNKVTWDQVNTQEKYKFAIKEHFKKLRKSDAIPGIGTNTELMNKLFTSKEKETFEYSADFGEFLLVKTSEIAFKEVTFEEVKERIRLEFAFENAEKVLGNIQ